MAMWLALRGWMPCAASQLTALLPLSRLGLSRLLGSPSGLGPWLIVTGRSAGVSEGKLLKVDLNCDHPKCRLPQA